MTTLRYNAGDDIAFTIDVTSGTGAPTIDLTNAKVLFAVWRNPKVPDLFVTRANGIEVLDNDSFIVRVPGSQTALLRGYYKFEAKVKVPEGTFTVSEGDIVIKQSVGVVP